MNLTVQIAMPDSPDVRALNIVAARQLLNELISAEHRVGNDLQPSETNTPIRTPDGRLAGFWSVTQ